MSDIPQKTVSYDGGGGGGGGVCARIQNETTMNTTYFFNVLGV